MATSSLLLSTLRRRSRPFSSLSALSRLLRNPYPNSSSLPSQFPIHSLNSLSSLHFLSHRSFSARPDDNSDFIPANSYTESPLSESEPINPELDAVTDAVTDGSILPVRAVISLLDGFHDLTGLPWWIVIVSSTVAMRMTLFPLLILQMHKMKKVSEFFPKLPPPFPPPLSGRSFISQFSLFQKERRAIGCPSYLWCFAYLSVQAPCFLLWMASIRRMSLNNHPGFDSGGTLWFQSLTEFPHGVLGSIFPFLIAGLHYINIQLAFNKSPIRNMSGILGFLSKYYKQYLDLLTVALFFIGYSIPQGSLVYWVTNSSLTAIQQLSLQHPDVRAKLGFPDKGKEPENSEEMVAVESVDSSNEWQKVSPQNLSPYELLALSVRLLSSGQRDRAIPLLKMALRKDPDHIKVLIVMGQTLLQGGQCAEAIEHLERAISKLFLTGNTSAEDVDHLILASQWAGVAFIRQGKKAEGVVHLERVASLEEPEDPKSKAHYFDGLLLLASALCDDGRKAEAVRYLRSVVAYDPSRKEFLDQLENEEDNVASDLASSRRRDY